MRLNIITRVKCPYKTVRANFSKELFEYLSPPFPKASLLRYDGNSPRDIVHLELDFLLFKNEWISEITEQEEKEESSFFIDKGKKLPFFLGYWRHKHVLEKVSATETQIGDHIHFEAPIKSLSFLVYPMILGLFLFRIPAYKKFFAHLEPKS